MLRNGLIVSLVILCAVLLCHCTPHSVCETQNEYDDSLSLAQAYSTLDNWQCIFPDDYAHACYHYGRLLCAKDNYVDAMKVFIKATHSRTRDYYVLGRVYNNIGEVCHLAGEYQLSYDMYAKSADYFLQNGDSASYFYALSSMVYELAEQGKSEDAIYMMDSIAQSCKDTILQYRLLETIANLYRKLNDQQTKSLYYNAILNTAVRGIAQKQSNTQQALSFLRETDTCSASSKQEIDTERQNAIEAIELLKEEINETSQRPYIYVGLSIVLFVCTGCILIYLQRKRKKHHRIIKELRQKEYVKEELTQTINSLSIRKKEQCDHMHKEIAQIASLVQSKEDMQAQLCWNNYSQMCIITNRRLYGIIDRLAPYALSEKEIRLCVLVLLQASTNKMVDMIPYSHSGLGKFKYTTARKLGTTTTNLYYFLLNLLV